MTDRSSRPEVTYPTGKRGDSVNAGVGHAPFSTPVSDSEVRRSGNYGDDAFQLDLGAFYGSNSPGSP